MNENYNDGKCHECGVVVNYEDGETKCEGCKMGEIG